MADEHTQSQPRAGATVAVKAPHSAQLGQPNPAPAPSASPTQSVEIKGTVKIESSSKDLSFLGSFGWPLFAAFAVLVLCGPIRGILTAIQKRIEDGADVDTPIGSVKTGSAKQRDQRATREAHEIERDQVGIAPATPERIRTIKSRYLLAEDLALQALQTEFGVPVSANVTSGGQQFDGVFGIGEVGYLVEVKLVRNPKSETVARRSVLQLSDSIKRVGWKNPRGMLVIVYDVPNMQVDLEIQKEMIEAVAREAPVLIDVRTYNLQALADKYNVALPVA